MINYDMFESYIFNDMFKKLKQILRTPVQIMVIRLNTKNNNNKNSYY